MVPRFSATYLNLTSQLLMDFVDLSRSFKLELGGQKIEITLLQILGTLLVWFVVDFVWSSLPSAAEAPKPYDVDVPPQCQPGWMGEILNKPTIKVRMFTLFALTNCSGYRIQFNSMLRTSDRRIAGPRSRSNPCRHRRSC